MNVVGTTVYDKVNECEATITRTSMVAGESLCYHLRDEKGQEWCQWPRNVVKVDSVAAMSKRWDEINEELERVHQQLAERTGRPTEDEVQAAQASLIAERNKLESAYVRMRRGGDFGNAAHTWGASAR